MKPSNILVMWSGEINFVYTDYKPLQYAFLQNLEKATSHQARYLDFLSQLTIGIRYVPGKDNIIVDALSRIKTLHFSNSIDYGTLVKIQVYDPELEAIIRGSANLKIKQITMSGTSYVIFRDFSSQQARPVLTQSFRKTASNLMPKTCDSIAAKTIK